MENKNLEKKISKTEIARDGIENKSTTAAQGITNWLKTNWKNSTMLVLGAAMSTGALAQKQETEKGDTLKYKMYDTEKNLNIENETKKDTTKKESSYFYSEYLNDPELKNTTGSPKELIEGYKSGRLNAYEVHNTETRFGELRREKYKNSTTEKTISYKGKEIKVNLFNKGCAEQIKQYYKDLGFSENSTITRLVDKNWNTREALKLSDINETFYEEVVNLKRTQFIKGAVYNKKKEEYKRYAYLNGEEGDKGFPVIILHGNINGKETVWLVALAPCVGNNTPEFMDADCCDDIKVHNESVKGK